ncbi:MAG: hypothetical protein QM724_07800 [Flavobacteriales bacterium]
MIRAIKLYNTPDGGSAFVEGTVPELEQLQVEHVIFQATAPQATYALHPAPRRQYVITLKGRLEFIVTDGSIFILGPGDVLLATDVHGSGHSWRTLEGDGWERLYAVLRPGAPDGFTPLVP